MSSRLQPETTKSSGPVRRWLKYAFYDWTREMPKSKRFFTWIGILIQGYAIWAGISHSLMWPIMWPHGFSLYFCVWLLYVIGSGMMNAMLTSEFLRKTQFESDQIAAQQIQKTLQPEKLEEMPGYKMEVFYQPYRAVSGDYFDVIELPANQTLFAVADVSGKGMPAALLAANIQALVRSLANVDADPLALARQINNHLNRYTPSNRFATAVFIRLNRDSGELTYVNAGHNAPILFSAGSAMSLAPTGMPIGLLSGADYEAGTAVIPFGGSLLIFTDGLTDALPDSIRGSDPEGRLRNAITDDPAKTMLNLKSLIDPKLSEDDVTILLVKRVAASVSIGARE
jgi:sigma-B regulation protein RsbU (phosphoserine phosphatase)